MNVLPVCARGAADPWQLVAPAVGADAEFVALLQLLAPQARPPSPELAGGGETAEARGRADAAAQRQEKRAPVPEGEQGDAEAAPARPQRPGIAKAGDAWTGAEAAWVSVQPPQGSTAGAADGSPAVHPRPAAAPREGRTQSDEAWPLHAEGRAPSAAPVGRAVPAVQGPPVRTVPPPEGGDNPRGGARELPTGTVPAVRLVGDDVRGQAGVSPAPVGFSDPMGPAPRAVAAHAPAEPPAKPLPPGADPHVAPDVEDMQAGAPQTAVQGDAGVEPHPHAAEAGQARASTGAPPPAPERTTEPAGQPEVPLTPGRVHTEPREGHAPGTRRDEAVAPPVPDPVVGPGVADVSWGTGTDGVDQGSGQGGDPANVADEATRGRRRRTSEARAELGGWSSPHGHRAGEAGPAERPAPPQLPRERADGASPPHRLQVELEDTWGQPVRVEVRARSEVVWARVEGSGQVAQAVRGEAHALQQLLAGRGISLAGLEIDTLPQGRTRTFHDLPPVPGQGRPKPLLRVGEVRDAAGSVDYVV